MDSVKAAEAALKTIAKNGRVLPLSRSSRSFDNVSGEPNGIVSQAGEITAIVLPRYKGLSMSEMDDALRQAVIRGQAKTVLAAASGATFPPKPLDTLTFDGADWEIKGVTTLAPVGVPILYTIGVIQK